MNETRLIVLCNWERLGTITLDDEHRLAFPKTTTTSGAYTFAVDEKRYIGEAVNLRQRFNGYRNPGPSQQTNLRMNPLLVDAAAQGVRIDIATTATAIIDGVEHALDLSRKSARLLVESAAITTALLNGDELLNL